MKNLIHLAFILFAAVSCSLHDAGEPGPEEGQTAELTVGVTVPETGSPTRSFSENASIDPLYLVVFDRNGYLKEVARATDFHTSGDETLFKVTLRTSSERRIVHFIANCPEAASLPFGTEWELVGAMKVSGTRDAYWQRVELSGGIPASTPAALRRVPLVRNFLKISFSSEAPDFTLETFAVMNVPDRGSVAPYRTEGGGFAVFAAAGGSVRPYADILGDGYAGFMPADMSLQHTDASALTFQSAQDPFYMYERTYSGDAGYTFAIVKGRYQGDSRYYKVDLVHKDDVTQQNIYYNLLRNFHYAVKIKKVTTEGYATPAEAAASIASNNIIGSLEISSLLNVSNGTSRLFVSFTDTTLTTGDEIRLMYKFIPDIASGTVSNGLVQMRALSGEVLEQNASVASSDVASGTWAGWRAVTIDPKDPTFQTRTQSLVLYTAETATSSALSRTVNLTLRNPYTFELSCNSPVSSTVNSAVNLSVSIPDGIRENLFPLEFQIEARKRSIYPDASRNALPIRFGTSLFDATDIDSYSYIKTLTFAEYQTLAAANDRKTFVCHFKTNRPASATDIMVSNKYFTPATTSFTN